MLLWHHPINLNFYYRKKQDLVNLFLSGVFRKVSVTLLSLFSPIYIYTTAIRYGLSPIFATIAVFVFFLIMLLSKLVTLFISENLSQKIGFKGTIKLSALPFAAFIPAIVIASNNPVLFIFAAFLWGAHAGLFWWGYHGYFIKSADKNHFGQTIGEAGLLETLASVATPVMGAILASMAGFSAMYAASAFFMLASLVLLGKDHDKRQRNDVRIKEVLVLIGKLKSISLAYMGTSAEGFIYYAVWPLFLYLHFGQLISLGFVVTLSSFFAAVFALFVGKWVDQQRGRKIVTLGSWLVFVSWMIRYFFRFPVSFVFADSLYNFSDRMLTLPLNALTYKKAIEGGSSARAILFREVSFIVGAVVALVFLVFVLLAYQNLGEAFLLAGLFGLLPLVAVARRRLEG